MFDKMLNRLIDTLKECRFNMHEPDEQEVEVIVSGYYLDNAFGDNPRDNCGEFTVGITRDRGDYYEWFNLSSLLALARTGNGITIDSKFNKRWNT